jgi:hypothetical protein
MKTYRYAGLAVLALFLSQTSFALKAPEWMTGTSKKYPSDKYLIGVGIGSDLDAARASARAEIAKIFQTRIIQSSQEITKERSAQGGGDAGFAAEASNELTTRTSTDDVLQGTEIPETYQDTKKNSYYALAVLDKVKMRQSLSRDMADLEETVESQVALSRKTTSVIDQIRALTAALKARDSRETLLIKKRIVDTGIIPDMPLTLLRPQIVKERGEALKKVLFVLESSDEGNLSGIIGERITGLGFNVVASTAAAAADTVIAVKSSIGVAPVERNNPNWKFYNWNATMAMRDLSDSGKVITAIARQGQVSHISESAARDKAVADAAHTLAVAVGQQLEQYFFGD